MKSSFIVLTSILAVTLNAQDPDPKGNPLNPSSTPVVRPIGQKKTANDDIFSSSIEKSANIKAKSDESKIEPSKQDNAMSVVKMPRSWKSAQVVLVGWSEAQSISLKGTASMPQESLAFMDAFPYELANLIKTVGANPSAIVLARPGNQSLGSPTYALVTFLNYRSDYLPVLFIKDKKYTAKATRFVEGIEVTEGDEITEKDSGLFVVKDKGQFTGAGVLPNGSGVGSVYESIALK